MNNEDIWKIVRIINNYEFIIRAIVLLLRHANVIFKDRHFFNKLCPFVYNFYTFYTILHISPVYSAINKTIVI